MNKPKRFFAQSTMMASEDNEGVISGVAVPFDQVGHFPGDTLVAIAPGSASACLSSRQADPVRDILCLKSHLTESTLARTNNGTLKFAVHDDRVEYSAQLNMEDPEGLSVWAKVKRGDFAAASIGFQITDAEKRMMADTSPEAKSSEPVRVIWATGIDIFEVSILAHGAFVGATTYLSDTWRNDKSALYGMFIEEGQYATVSNDDESDGEQSPDSTDEGDSNREQKGDALTVAEVFQDLRQRGIYICP